MRPAPAPTGATRRGGSRDDASCWLGSRAARSAGSRRVLGSATVELVFVVPFVLITLAAVWDLRTYIGYRTDLAREMYVVAEAIADDPTGAPPFEVAIGRAEARLRGSSVSGSIRAAVIVRGTQRADSTPCPDGAWCPPVVTARWPAMLDDSAGTWTRDDDGACRVGGSSLPAPGAHFGPGQRVLPNEGTDPDGDGPDSALPEADWVSRNLRDAEWWVVVDTCFDPRPGLFIGRLANMAERMLDTSFALRKRAAWGSVHDRTDCDWCEA